MKGTYIQQIKRAFRSPQFWFAFALIIVSSAWNAVYHLDKYGVLYKTEIGTAEFFYACVMLGNTLFQISVPVIPIFVSMYTFGMDSKISVNGHISKRIFAAITVSISVFILSFLLIAIIGVIFFPSSTGDILEIGGPFSDSYYKNPFSIIPITIIYSSIFAAIYSLFGLGIGMNLKKNKVLAFIIPLSYYFCFRYIMILLPNSLKGVSYWLVPLDTFNLVGSTVPLSKKIVEMLIVLLVASILILIAFIRLRKREKDK